MEISDVRLSIMPKVEKLADWFSPKIRNSIYQKLAMENLYYDDGMGDISDVNIGLLENGEPVIIDTDAVIHIDEIHDSKKEEIQEKMDQYKNLEQHYSWENPDGTWKQHTQFPQIWNSGQPEAGQLNGAYPREDIEKALDKFNGDEKKLKIMGEVLEAGYGEGAKTRLVTLAEEHGRVDDLVNQIRDRS